jgi:hypothetical protein
MSKLLIFLLFTVVVNYEEDGIPYYDTLFMDKLMGSDVRQLNVKEGEEFYISIPSSRSYKIRLLNYNEITDALVYFGKNGEEFKYSDPSHGWYLSPIVFSYYRFKAIKPSYNKITLKFKSVDRDKDETYKKTKLREFDLFIKLNILPKNNTS